MNLQDALSADSRVQTDDRNARTAWNKHEPEPGFP